MIRKLQLSATIAVTLTSGLLLHACGNSVTSPPVASPPANSQSAEVRSSPENSSDAASPQMSSSTPTVSDTSSIVATTDLSNWQGTYTFSEALPPGPGSSQVMQYEITVYQQGSDYLARVNRDGFQTVTRLVATVKPTGSNRIGFYFKEYAEGNMREIYSPGGLLFQLEQLPGNRMTVIWGAISSLTPNQTESELEDLQIIRSTPMVKSFPSPKSLQSRPLTSDQFKIADIASGATESEVKQILGRPEQVNYSESACVGPVGSIRYPEGLAIELAEGSDRILFVYSVSATTSKWATVDGVRVGDTRQTVLDTYGLPSSEGTDENGLTSLYYRGAQDDLRALYFVLQGDRVIEIGYTEQLC